MVCTSTGLLDMFETIFLLYEGVLEKIDYMIKHFDRYGNWGICFTYGSWFALGGLAAVGKTYNNCLTMRKGVDFLLKIQRDNGGWGESYLSCPKKVNVSTWNVLWASLINSHNIFDSITIDSSSSIFNNTPHFVSQIVIKGRIFVNEVIVFSKREIQWMLHKLCRNMYLWKETDQIWCKLHGQWWVLFMLDK